MRFTTKAAAAAAVVGLLAVAGTARATTQPTPSERQQLTQLAETLRWQNSSPGVGFTYGDGVDDVTITAGTRALLSFDTIGPDDKVRVGSDTKMFVAATVLLLEDEGVLNLDVPIDQYLPGVLRYPAGKVPAGADPAAYDGRTVTMRQLLQHTSGVPDYADLAYVLNPVHQLLAPTPKDLIAHGLQQSPYFLPGTGWHYSNTNYALVGLIVQRVTGRSIGTEIADRIVAPLGLTNTFFAERGQRALPGPHVHGYLTQAIPLDMTYFEPSVWGTAGALVSTANDMNTFLSALLAGDVLPPARLAEMQDEVPYLTGGYGLGLVRMPLSCGDAWGHGGFLAGYQTLGLAMPDGRHAFYTMNTSQALNLVPPPVPRSITELFELALC